MRTEIRLAVNIALLTFPSILCVVRAQDAGLAEIVVTAQRREQDMQAVGVSVTAVSGDAARELGVFNSKDISKIAPGVVFDSTSGGMGAVMLTIRGVSQSDFSPSQESPNSLYVDDVYISSSNESAFPLYDLARVEVLRGPQGTLFGRASSGGLANFITNRPTADTNGYFEAGYGNYNAYYIEGAVGGSVTDSVRGRIAGRVDRGDGWFKNYLPGGKDSFETNSYGLRGQLEADLTDSLRARLSVGFDKSPSHAEGTYRPVAAYIDSSGQPAPLPANLDVYGTGPGNDLTGYRDTHNKVQSGDFNNVGFFANEKFSPTLYLEWKAGSATVTSITNYTSFKITYAEDTDGGPVNFAVYDARQKLTQYSEELRATATIDRLTWTAGVFYLNIDQDNGSTYTFPVLSGTDFAFSDSNDVSQQLKSIAGFGQLEYKLSDSLTGTLGLRYTHDQKDFSSVVSFFELGNGYSGGTGSTVFDPPLVTYDFSKASVGDRAHESEGMWSGKVELDYRPADEMLLYGSVSRGVKGPGFNTNLGGSLTIEQTPFAGERLIAYEVGSKNEFLNRTLRVNASAFYYDYSDYQGYAFVGTQGLVGNYQATFKGGELEVTAAPGAGWTLGLSVSFIDSKLKDVPTAYSGVRDEQSVMAPKWTSNGFVRKTFAIGPNSLDLLWSGNYVDDRYNSIDNNFATFIPGSFIHDARATYTMSENKLEFAVWVNNISDTARQNASFDVIASQGSVTRSYAKPRTFGISVRKRF